MVKAMVALINNGKVIAPHLLQAEESGKSVTPYHAATVPSQIASPSSPYWGLVREAMFGMANAPNLGQVINFSILHLTELRRKAEPHRFSA